MRTTVPQRFQLFFVALTATLLIFSSPCRADANGDAAAALAKAGLTKFGVYYALPVDAKLPERLREIQKAQTQQTNAMRQRASLLAEIDRNELAMSKLLNQSTMTQVLRGVSSVKAPEGHTTLGNQQDSLTDQIATGQATLKQQFDQLRTLTPDPPPSSLILALADELDAAAAQYAILKTDADITTAIADLKTAGGHADLGPSKVFTEKLTELHDQRTRIRQLAIPATKAGHSLMVTAGIDPAKPAVPMMIDPACPIVLLSPEVAQDTKIIFNPDDRISVLTADGAQVKAERGVIKTLTVGRFIVNDIPCAVMPVQSGAKTCLLGASFLDRFSYELDRTAGELRIAPAGQSIAGGRKLPTTSPAVATSRPTMRPEH